MKCSYFHTEQQKAFDKIVKHHGGIVWMGLGEGKTRVGIIAALQLANNSVRLVTLVVCRREAFYDFKEEVATLQLPVDVIEAEELPFQWKPERHTFVLLSNGKLLSKTTMAIVEMLHFKAYLGNIIVDEGYLYKNPQAKTHLALRQYTELHPTILLSGSIMTARDLVDIFGQNAAAGRMKQLSQSLTAFRTEFQTGINDRGFRTYYPKPGSYNKIIERLDSYTHIYMPRKMANRHIKLNIHKVPASPIQRELFKELKETAAVEGFFELKNMANVVQKAQQISNGWLKEENGEYVNIPAPKVDRTLALADEIIASDKRVVIWCGYRHDIDRLLASATFDCDVAIFRGNEPFDIEKWKNPKTKVCIATVASGSSVNHFAQVPYGIYFSQDNKWFNLQQSQGRHTRRSSEHSETFFTFLHTEGSLDPAVYWSVQTARSQERGFVNESERREIEKWVKGE